MILDETIHLLRERYGSLHNIFLQKVLFGLHITVVELSEGLIGFASTVPPADNEVHCKKDKRYFGPFSPLQFTGQSINDLFALPNEKNLILSLKAAVINALSSPLLGNNRGTLLVGADPVDLINREWLSGKKSKFGWSISFVYRKIHSPGLSVKSTGAQRKCSPKQ